MQIILVLTLLLIPSFGYADSETVTEKKFKALEEKVERLTKGIPKLKGDKSFDAHGVKKQGLKNPYHHKKGLHFESKDGKFSTNLQWRAQTRFSKGIRSDPRTSDDFSPD